MPFPKVSHFACEFQYSFLLIAMEFPPGAVFQERFLLGSYFLCFRKVNESVHLLFYELFDKCS